MVRMTSTPLWVPLAVAIVGLLGTVIGTVSGVLITQRRADRREIEASTKETERESERWRREDAARTFEERREAYLGFYYANGEAGTQVHEYLVSRLFGSTYSSPPEFSAPEAEEKLKALEVYGTQRVLDLAHAVQTQYRHMAREAEVWDPSMGTEQPDCRGDEWHMARKDLLRTMREELGIPEDETGGVAYRSFSHLARYAAAAAAEHRRHQELPDK